MSLLDGRAIRDWCREKFFAKENILNTEEKVLQNTDEGKGVDALVIKEVFQNVSDGKRLLASAITDKGVSTDAGDSFAVMAGNIEQIQSGCGESTGNLKVQVVNFQNSSYNSLIYIDIKKYSDNYKNLVYGKNLIVSATSMYFQRQSTISSGWTRFGVYVIGKSDYNQTTGILTITTAASNGTSGQVYIIETE